MSWHLRRAIWVLPWLLPTSLAAAAGPARARRGVAFAASPAAAAGPAQGARTAATPPTSAPATKGAAASEARQLAPQGVPADAPPTTEPAADPDLDWLAEPAALPAAPAGRGVAGAAVGLVCAAAAAAGGAAWQRRRRQPAATREQEQIALLATRALGGKQRLALVQVCGERLLLASCDGELTLLSHLPSSGEAALGAEDAAASTAEATNAGVPVPEAQAYPPNVAVDAGGGAPRQNAPSPVFAHAEANFAATLATKSPAAAPVAPIGSLPAPSLAPTTAQRPSGESLSGDLAGLRAWRARSANAHEVRA